MSRLTQNFKAVKILRENFGNGEIAGKEQPAAVHQMDATFKIISYSIFKPTTAHSKKDIVFSPVCITTENLSHFKHCI